MLIDRFMFRLYGYIVAYHSLRGAGVSVTSSLRKARNTTRKEQVTNEKVKEFQVGTWNTIKDIAKAKQNESD